ncbi:hypothetical protein tb265_45840 [Gemmatimonadetes bacterium T265]|nr:hypothetical protein tb265_45840 [Gemmatimonadetes bacterium T265]
MPSKRPAGRRPAAPPPSTAAASPPDTPPGGDRAAGGAVVPTAAGGQTGAGVLDAVILDGELLASVRALIAAARQHVAQRVNTTLVLLWVARVSGAGGRA